MVENILTTTVPLSFAGPIIGLSIIPAGRVLQKRNARAPASTYDPECLAVGHDGNRDDSILAAKQP